VARTSDEAAETFYPYYSELLTERFAERGWPPVTRSDFEKQRSPRGAMMIGSPAEVVAKILAEHRLFGHQRFLLQPSMGTLPHREMIRTIELYATEVAPAVRQALGIIAPRG
jgi:alkanesulfonate monooxygenase SsuD/methylene tetrahydromethanopterin reductase-like flavin-dependent oxidoreductase (luciferase family)